MKLKHVWIDNYRHFRSIFENQEDADLVQKNLEKLIENDIIPDETAHLKLQYWPNYDEEGLAGFEVTQAKFAHGQAYVNVTFTSTAK